MMEMKLADLARLSGVSPRTIRLYITKGLVPGPLRAGRKAAYGAEHLSALKSIRTMQDRGLTLLEIRQRLTSRSDGPELPEPERWTSYELAPDVKVVVRGDAGGWRLRQIQGAIATMNKCLVNEHWEGKHDDEKR